MTKTTTTAALRRGGRAALNYRLLSMADPSLPTVRPPTVALYSWAALSPYVSRQPTKPQ
jgi:hypothetical protein